VGGFDAIVRAFQIQSMLNQARASLDGLLLQARRAGQKERDIDIDAGQKETDMDTEDKINREVYSLRLEINEYQEMLDAMLDSSTYESSSSRVGLPSDDINSSDPSGSRDSLGGDEKERFRSSPLRRRSAREIEEEEEEALEASLLETESRVGFPERGQGGREEEKKEEEEEGEEEKEEEEEALEASLRETESRVGFPARGRSGLEEEEREKQKKVILVQGDLLGESARGGAGTLKEGGKEKEQMELKKKQKEEDKEEATASSGAEGRQGSPSPEGDSRDSRGQDTGVATRAGAVGRGVAGEEENKDARFDMTGARAIEVGNQVFFVKEEPPGGDAVSAPGASAPGASLAAARSWSSNFSSTMGKVGFGSEKVEVVSFRQRAMRGEFVQGAPNASQQAQPPDSYYTGSVSRAANYTLIPRPLYAPFIDPEVNPLAAQAASATGIVLDASARPHLYPPRTADSDGRGGGGGGGGGGGKVQRRGSLPAATAYDALWMSKGDELYRAWARKNTPEVMAARVEADLGYGSKKYPPGKKWFYNGAPLKKQRFNESSGMWYQLEEEEDDIEFSKMLPGGETFIYPTNLDYGYQWFPDAFDERPGSNRSLWDQPGSSIRPEDIAQLPLLRQQKIMDFSEGIDEQEGLSIVDLRFQEELLQEVNRSLGTPGEAEATAKYYYYMLGITEDMQIPPLHELSTLINNRSIDDPVFAEQMCGQKHMKTLILADPRLRDAHHRRGIRTLDPNTVASQPPRSTRKSSLCSTGEDAGAEAAAQERAGSEGCGECEQRKTWCPLMALQAAIDRGAVNPLARSLDDAEEQGVEADGEREREGERERSLQPAGLSAEGAAGGTGAPGPRKWGVRRGDGVWVQGRYVHGVEGKAMTTWEEELASAEASARALGQEEEGLEEGAVGSTSQVTGFETEETLWYLRRLQYSMYVHAMTAPEGMWCGGKQVCQ
jgi:hypothetical protein